MTGSAVWNMAVDEALLTYGGRDPVLRLYEWQAPAVTIGRFQDAQKSLNADRIRELDLPVVRRPTGGRAVYHGADLTYSLVFPTELAGGRSVRESYTQLSMIFVEALRGQGIVLKQGERAAPGRESAADCFALSAAPDHTLDGRKVIGSAQLRRGSSVLQQGSIRLWPMTVPEGLIRGVHPHRSDLATDATPSEVGEALTNALSALWHVEWVDGDLSEAERRLAGLLAQERYSQDTWNLDGEDRMSCESLLTVSPAP